ncbi:MAG: hypothetical protein QG559_1696 [Campylobacterota bacterium]|nr:hypothetical protein [Campylobacterota bacterium]
MNIKLMLEETLQNIDNFFKVKSKKDVYMVYIMIVAVISFIAYPFYELSQTEFNAIKAKVDDVTVKINTDKAYLKANPEEKIAQLDLDIKKLEVELAENKKTNLYIKEKIMTISSLIYDEKLWGEYLDSISKNALKHNVKIINFVNKYVDNNESFGHVLDIKLDVTAKYADTINFVNSLEESELVVDMHTFDIKAKDTLDSKLNISVWGITYE